MVKQLIEACDFDFDPIIAYANRDPGKESAEDTDDDEEIDFSDNNTVVCLANNVAFFYLMAEKYVTVKLALVFRNNYE